MRLSVRASDSLKYAYRALCLIALLVAGQQGAVVHELGHLTAAQSTVAQVGVDATADGACALCPLFAQVATAAFSHSFEIPSLSRPGIGRAAELPIDAADSAVPTPRSRGPPSLS
jgi:hypothetical protein